MSEKKTTSPEATISRTTIPNSFKRSRTVELLERRCRIPRMCCLINIVLSITAVMERKMPLSLRSSLSQRSCIVPRVSSATEQIVKLSSSFSRGADTHRVRSPTRWCISQHLETLAGHFARGGGSLGKKDLEQVTIDVEARMFVSPDFQFGRVWDWPSRRPRETEHDTVRVVHAKDVFSLVSVLPSCVSTHCKWSFQRPRGLSQPPRTW